jgi:hypothetical protein
MANTANDFLTETGAFDVSKIMAAAHRKAAAEFARTVCVYAGIDVRVTGAMGTWSAQYVATARTVEVRALKIPASASYRAELARALADYWHRARVMRSRFIPAPVAVAAPLALAA